MVTPVSTIDTDWLYYILVSLNLNKYATGVAQPGLSVKNILPVLIPVPPLSEQRQLVIKIQELETKITQAQNSIDKAQNKKEAILKEFL